MFKKPIYSLGTINKTIIRSVAVNSAAVCSEKSTQLKSWKEIPGPTSMPIIGKLMHFIPRGVFKTPGDNVAELLYKQYGPIVKLDGLFGSPNLIFLFDPEAISQVLRGENTYPNRPGFKSLVTFRNSRKKHPDEPTGLVSDQGEVWQKFRSTVNHIMLQPKTIKLYRTTLNEVADDMIARLKSLRNEKNMIDAKFDVEMNLWALESIGVVALGGRLNCFDPNLPEDSPVRKLIQIVHDIFEIVARLDFRPNLSKFFTTPTLKRAMSLYEEQFNLSKYFIERAIENLNNKDSSLNSEKGVLEKLLEIDENIAITMASDMLFAGIDTSSNTMTLTLYLLATNQEKQNKLREEIMSSEDKRPYLKACIKESMRMMPVASGNLRLTTKEYNILGYKIPKDMQVIFSHQILSSMEDQFPRAKEFLPERWLIDKSDPLYYGNAHPFAFMPFGFGTRSCIGRRIAELEVETFLAKVIKNFQVEWFGPPLRVRQNSLNYAVEPFNFIFKDV